MDQPTRRVPLQTKSDVVDRLAAVDTFSDLKRRELKRLADRMWTVEISEGQETHARPIQASGSTASPTAVRQLVPVNRADRIWVPATASARSR